MPRCNTSFEEAGGQRLPLGGKNGYLGVRGKQGRKRDKFQGFTPNKSKEHCTGLFDTAQEAAIARAQVLEDLELGMQRSAKKAQPAASSEPAKKAQVGVFLGTLLAQQRAGIPTARAYLLSQQQAAAALAGGMQQGFAFEKA